MAMESDCCAAVPDCVRINNEAWGLSNSDESKGKSKGESKDDGKGKGKGETKDGEVDRDESDQIEFHRGEPDTDELVEIMLSEFKDRVEQYMESEGLTNEYVAAEEMVEGYVMTGTVNDLMDEYKSKQSKQRDESTHGTKRPK